MLLKCLAVFLVISTTCYGSCINELESIFEEKNLTHRKLSSNCNSAQSTFKSVKRNIEYFWPFVQSFPLYLVRQAMIQTSVMFQHASQRIGFSSEPEGFYKKQLWSLERPYRLDFKPDREPVLIHNMLIKFHHTDPHLLNHKESDFMQCITPAEQAKAYGGELMFLDTSCIKASAIHNPSLIQHQGKVYMTLRVQGRNILSIPWCADTFLAEVTEDFQISSAYPLIKDISHTHEDAKLVSFKGNIYVSYVTDVSYKCGNYNACMEIGKLSPKEQIQTSFRPNINDNKNKDALQKNWLFFEKDEKFLVISTIDPMVVYDATGDLNNPKGIIRKEKAIKDWPFGQIRCSTTPIWIEEENKYLSFFHSHILTTDGIREYFLGALLFDNDFNITNYTKKPLFVSTPHVKRYLYANTILPYGCILQNDQLILSVGINDKAAAIMKLPVKRIISELTPKEG